MISVVTGGASGIGAAIAKRLVARGDTVVVADVNLPAAQSIAEQLAAQGPGRAEPAAVDVTERDDVHALVEDVVGKHGRIDLFFNNAGIGTGGLAEELTSAHWDRTLDVNLRGVVHGVEAVYPLMLRQESGHIVNTASLAGLVPAPLMAAYTTSKWAVVGLSRALREEGAASGVKVSALCPAFAATPLLDEINSGLPATLASKQTKRHVQRIQGRLATADEVAAAALAGVAKNKALILVPGKAKLAAYGFRFAPQLVTAVIRYEVARYRRDSAALSPTPTIPTP
ncbi:MAG TPA: SDR family oxidoreductase [Actinomycetales bacterium]|nr:SDR family oxidoreductase [Actinomycetales bacterium]